MVERVSKFGEGDQSIESKCSRPRVNCRGRMKIGRRGGSKGEGGGKRWRGKEMEGEKERRSG